MNRANEVQRLPRKNTGSCFHYCVLIVLTATSKGRCLCHRERTERHRQSLLHRILPQSMKTLTIELHETLTATVL